MTSKRHLSDGFLTIRLAMRVFGEGRPQRERAILITSYRGTYYHHDLSLSTVTSIVLVEVVFVLSPL